MQAVILAAGASTRLRPLTNEIPKCLLPIAGETLLERYLRLLERSGVTETVIVSGFNHAAVRAEANRYVGSMNIHHIENTEYLNTNSAESFLLTQNYITEDFLLLNADIYFSQQALQTIIDAPYSCVAIDSSASYIKDEMFVNYDEQGHIQAMSKLLPEKLQGQGKSVQIVKFLYEDKDILFSRLTQLIDHQKVSYPADAYDTLIEQKKLFAVDTAGELSHELDTVEDYESLLQKLESSHHTS